MRPCTVGLLRAAAVVRIGVGAGAHLRCQVVQMWRAHDAGGSVGGGLAARVGGVVIALGRVVRVVADVVPTVVVCPPEQSIPCPQRTPCRPSDHH